MAQTGHFLTRSAPAFDLASLAFVAAFVLIAVRFAFVQEIWIDEATQLAGASAPFGDMMSWLLGDRGAMFAAPDDRMPPLSYVLDWSWLRIAGPSPTGLRLFHLAIFAIGVAFLGVYLRSAFGAVAALVFAAAVAFSPTLIALSIEIRAYPIFFALTCASLVYFLKTASAGWRGEASTPAIFAGLCVLNVYTHFFALLATGAFFLALLVRYAADFAKLRTILLVGAAAAVLSAGMLPFALAASDVGLPAEAPFSLAAIVKYLLTLIAGSVNMIYPLGAAAWFAGFGGLIAAALFLILLVRLGDKSAAHAALPLLTAAAIGVFVTLAAEFVSAQFLATKASYSIWLYPVFACLAAIGFAGAVSVGAWPRRASITALGFMMIGGAIATWTFACHQSLFIHGPSGLIMEQAAKAGGPVAIVYEQADPYGYAAIPVGARVSDAAQQWLFTNNDEALSSFVMGAAAKERSIAQDELRASGAIILVRLAQNTYRENRAFIAGAESTLAPGALVDELLKDPNWRLAESAARTGLYEVKFWRFERCEGCDTPQ